MRAAQSAAATATARPMFTNVVCIRCAAELHLLTERPSSIARPLEHGVPRTPSLHTPPACQLNDIVLLGGLVLRETS